MQNFKSNDDAQVSVNKGKELAFPICFRKPISLVNHPEIDAFVQNVSILLGYELSPEQFRLSLQGILVYYYHDYQIFFEERTDCFDWCLEVNSHFLDSYDFKELAEFVEDFDSIANYLYELREEGITLDMIEGIAEY